MSNLRFAGIRGAWVMVLGLGILVVAGTPGPSAADDPLARAIEAFERGENEAAARLFESHLKSNPSDARAEYFLGRIDFRKEDSMDDAVKRFKKATELSPQDSNYMHWLGTAYLNKLQDVSMFKKMGYAKKTRTAFAKAVELDPNNLDARESLFRYYMEAPGIAGGSETKALEQVEAIKALDQKAGHFAMASYYADEEKYDEAEKEYRAVLRIAPEDREALRRLGSLAQSREDWDSAFEVYEQILAEDPEDLASLYAYGRTAALSGKNAEQGVEYLTQYLAAEPQPNLPAHTWAHWRMGLIHEKSGDTAKARKAFEASLAADPGNKEAKKALKELS